jgi:F0F1-type ATP synthase assembly protein I
MRLGSNFRGMGLHMALGIQMVVVTVVGAGIGYWLDKRTGREPLFLILFFLLGAVGGLMLVWRALQSGGRPPER